MNSTPRRVQQSDIEALENQYMKAIQSGDGEAALRLTDKPCMVASAQGAMVVTEEAMRQMIEKPDYTLHDFKLADVQFRAVSDEVAVIGYKLHQELTRGGKPITLDTVNSSTWVRRGERWVCALHTEALQGDPWGSDRR